MSPWPKAIGLNDASLTPKRFTNRGVYCLCMCDSQVLEGGLEASIVFIGIIAELWRRGLRRLLVSLAYNSQALEEGFEVSVRCLYDSQVLGMRTDQGSRVCSTAVGDYP